VGKKFGGPRALRKGKGEMFLILHENGEVSKEKKKNEKDICPQKGEGSLSQ